MRINITSSGIINSLIKLNQVSSFITHFRRKPITWSIDFIRSLGFDIPRISVVVINYNYGRYLIDRLESIMSQSIGIYELIFVDDASDDDSLEILNRWMRQQKIMVTVIRNEKNSGSVFAQWKKGIEAVSGDFVWIAEADDLSETDFLQTVLPPMLADPGIVLSYCESKQMDSDGFYFADNYDFYLQHASDTLWVSDRVTEGISEITDILAILNSIPNVSAILFKRTALLEVIQQHSEDIARYTIAADYACYIRILLLGKVAYSRKNANIHRRHPQSIIARCHRMDLYHEIVSVQQWVMQRYNLDASVVKKIYAYRDYMSSEIHPHA